MRQLLIDLSNGQAVKRQGQIKSCDFKGDKQYCDGVFFSFLPLRNDHFILSLKPRDDGQTQIEEGSLMISDASITA